MMFPTLASRTLTAGAALSLLAAPAWADCQQEIDALDSAVVTAETGAATGDAPLPATEHQEEVLSGEQGTSEEAPMETAAGATGDVEATSMHQRQVMAQLDEQTKSEAAVLLDEAQELAQAGKEEACMAKLGEVRDLIGTN